MSLRQNSSGLKILIAPLDWGLGHATRCIPLIQQFSANGADIFIAADAAIKELLKDEFPKATFLSLKGYKIRYSKNPSALGIKILGQLPQIIKTMWQEHRWLNKMIDLHHFDAVISDNRFGLFSKKIPCIYITHQLRVMTGNSFTSKLASAFHHFVIKKYDQCWVPDVAQNGLAGKLSMPLKTFKHIRYIGPLSRLNPITNQELTYQWFISISGPEPQRTIFEEQILSQIHALSGNIFLVRGLPGKEISSIEKPNLTVRNHLAAKDYNELLAKSERVICRSGYTSVMDLVKINKRALLIPTPGQAEQEYLAHHLHQNGFFPSIPQNRMSLKDAAELIDEFPYQEAKIVMDDYKIVINEFVANLKSSNFAAQ